MKKLCVLLIVSLLTFFVCAGAEADRLPDYIYQGDDPYLPAVCDYILQAYGSFYAQEDVAIPSPLILETDDTDPQDVRLWGKDKACDGRFQNSSDYLEAEFQIMLLRCR